MHKRLLERCRRVPPSRTGWNLTVRWYFPPQKNTKRDLSWWCEDLPWVLGRSPQIKVWFQIGEFLVRDVIDFCLIGYESKGEELVGPVVISCIPHDGLLGHTDHIACWYVASIWKGKISQNLALDGHWTQLDDLSLYSESFRWPTRVQWIVTGCFPKKTLH